MTIAYSAVGKGIGIRSATIMGARLALLATVLPAAIFFVVTLAAALHTRLQGILITAVGMAMFIVAMILIPRLKPSGHWLNTPLPSTA